MIKHFGIWPLEVDKNNLFEEQKIFIVYLMAVIPSIENWQTQIDYESKLKQIINLTDVKIEQAEIDLAELHDKDLDELKKEKLKEEKENRLKKLNEKFGVQEEIKHEKIEGLPEPDKNPDTRNQQRKLWDTLQLKGLV